jgi:hypothetical protein
MWLLEDNGKALRNPGMGWVFHYYDDKLEEYGRELPPGDTLDEFPGMAVAYMRLPWSLIEPERDRFHWDVIDIPAQQWLRSGKRIALRFTSAESGAPTFATPEWVKRAGASGYYFEPGKGVVATSQHWEPDYRDPVFLAELDRFLRAAAARCDGKPAWTSWMLAASAFGEKGTPYLAACARMMLQPFAASLIFTVSIFGGLNLSAMTISHFKGAAAKSLITVSSRA